MKRVLVLLGAVFGTIGIFLCISSSIIVVLGLLLFFGGLSTIGLGYRFPSHDSSRTTIIVGYAFAALGGIIGAIIGAYLMQKENLEDKFHGKVIFAIGFVAINIILFLLPTRPQWI